MTETDDLPFMSKKTNGGAIIALEAHGYYLDVKQDSRGWSFKIDDWNTPKRAKVTPWKRISAISKFETSRLMKRIRDTLKEITGHHYEDALNRVLHLLEIKGAEWKIPEDEEEKNIEAPFFTTGPDGGPGSFVPSRLAEIIQKNRRFVATGEKSKVWSYNPENGLWEDNGVEIIQEVSTKLLGEKFKNVHVLEVLKHIRYTNYISPMILGNNSEKIVVKNGVLNLYTNELTPFDPELFEITGIPVKFDPEAKSPKIDKFITEIVPPGWLETLHEIIGYTLLKSYPIARIFIFSGGGGNGKSQLIGVIKKFLGAKNISGVTLQQIATNTFAAAQLHGKLANLCADIPSKPIKHTGIIKALTGGEDTVTAHFKFYALFDFVNYAKLIFSANEVPPADDNTPAWLRRPIIVDFPNVFPAGDPGTILNIGEKISTDEELSGLLNHALVGLQRVLKQGIFTNEKTLQKRAEEYIMQSNPAQYFGTQFVTMASSTFDKIEKPYFYKNYVQLCRALGRRPLISNKFSQEIVLYLPYIDDGDYDKIIGKTKKGKPRTRKTRVWYGIHLDKKKLDKKIVELNQNKNHRYDEKIIPQIMQDTHIVDINKSTIGGKETIVAKFTKTDSREEISPEDKEPELEGDTDEVSTEPPHNPQDHDSPGEKMAQYALAYLKREGGCVGRILFMQHMVRGGYHEADVVAVLGEDPRFIFDGETVTLAKDGSK